MGGGDRCAVYACGNDRRHPESFKVMPNAKYGLRFHICSDERKYPLWTRLLNRTSEFKVNKYTVVCSNHFQYGQPFSTSPNPTLFLKGYDIKPTKKRKTPTARKTPPPKRKRKSKAPRFVHCGTQVEPADIILTSTSNHDYHTNCDCKKTTCFTCTSKLINDLEIQVGKMKSQVEDAEEKLHQAEEKIKEVENKLAKDKRLSIFDICHSNHVIKLYTGLNSYEMFVWLLDQIRPHCTNMEYFRGKGSIVNDKFYQIHNHQKPGPKRSLPLEDELLLTLMKLRLNLLEEDIAFHFRISQSSVSQILSTWIPLLARELESFIYWPTQQEIKKYYPECFRKYEGCVRAIIDCTEIPIDRPSLAASNNEVYSQYKSRPTIKCLIGITPGGTISFVSKPAGGSKSDKQIVKMTNLIDKFEEGDICMADRGFNIQDLFLNKQVQLVIPPFKRTTDSTSQFTEEEDAATKTVANARIHVERAIGRLKEFQLMQGPIHLTMIDLMEASLIVCAALVNLQPALVPLTS